MSTTAADSIAAVVIPDTELVREITAFIRDTENDLLFDHSRRVFLFGVLPLELLYAGATFHDIGLTETYRTSMLRFEVDGANAACDFLLDHSVGDVDNRKVWLSIALHTTPNVPEFLDPEIALVTAGVETDVLGIDREALSPEALKVPSPPPTHDQISSAGYCERSTTATNTARTALPETSTRTYSSISTHRSSATISLMSSGTTAGPSEIHSDSTYLSSPKRKLPAGNKRSRGRPAHPVSESVDYLSLFMLQ
jgi:hypothetical protein